MQMKKLQWINRPTRLSIKSGCLAFHSDEETRAVLTTYEEEKTLYLGYKAREGAKAAFILVNTGTEGIRLTREEDCWKKEMVIHGVRTTDYLVLGNTEERPEKASIRITKKGDTLQFFDKDRIIAIYSFVNVPAAVSLGYEVSGIGEVSCTFRDCTE